MRICTAKASGINREAAKSGCAREWGGWGRISDDGPGQQNPDRSEGPWGRAAESARTEVFRSASSLTQCREPRWQQRARRAMANQSAGKVASELPALKPYRGKPAVRNFRGGNGNVGIIRSPVRAIALPDRERVRTDLCGGGQQWSSLPRHWNGAIWVGVSGNHISADKQPTSGRETGIFAGFQDL